MGVGAGLIGVLVGLAAGDRAFDADAISPPAPSSTTSPDSSIAHPSTFEMIPLAGAGVLQGDVALTPFPGAGAGKTLWVLRAGGSVVRRDDVEFHPGGFRHPMLITKGRLIFAGFQEAFMLNVDLVDPAVRLGDANFVVPGATPGLVWLVGRRAVWVAPLDVKTQTVGQRFEVDEVIHTPLAGMAEGLVVIPVDGDTNATAYWSPQEGLQPFEFLVSRQSGVYSAAANTAVVVSTGEIGILDFARNEFVSSIRLDLGDGNVSEVCLSPDQRHVAVVGSTGEAFVAETGSGAVLHRLTGVHGHNSIGWTSGEQLVYIADATDATWVEVLDISTGGTADVAVLRGSEAWWLTASGSMC